MRNKKTILLKIGDPFYSINLVNKYLDKTKFFDSAQIISEQMCLEETKVENVTIVSVLRIFRAKTL
jgi:hypothetical protein